MSIKEKWTDFKSLVASLCVWAETELSGKTGAEKQAAVVGLICEKFPWAFPASLVQRPLIKIAVAWVSTKIVAALNIVTDHDFADIVVDPETVVAASELPEALLVKAQNIEADTKQETIEERFKSLCERYGLLEDEAEAEEVEPEPQTIAEIVQEVIAEDKEKQETGNYFTRSEFVCGCGCGTNKVQPELIDMLNVIREAFGRPVTVTSGTRCVANNAAAGGATNSNHLTGHAADIRCSDRSMTPSQMHDVVMGLHRDGKIPQLAGISKNYDTIIHVDTSPKRADGALRTW